MVREIITISVGQCGIQLGNQIWDQYCTEHGIGESGYMNRNYNYYIEKDNSFRCFFEQVDYEFVHYFKNVNMQTVIGYVHHTENELKKKNNPLTQKVYLEIVYLIAMFLSSKDFSFNWMHNHFMSKDHRYVPRNLSIDLEPNVIDEIKTSRYAAIYNPQHLISSQEDAGNNFARGHFSKGKEIISQINEKLRKIYETCENCQGFFINHSIGGGTGSGLGSLILKKLTDNYKKKSKFGFEVFPSPIISNCVVEPYNSLLALNYLIDYTDISLVLDNEALYQKCQKNLDIKHPNYSNINRIIGKLSSSVTCSLRFQGELNVDMNELQTNLVPFPRIHFLISSMAPITTPKKKETQKTDAHSLCQDIFSNENFLVKIPEWNIESDPYMAVGLNYRGRIRASEANSSVRKLKEDGKISFMSWGCFGFKIGLNDIPPPLVKDDDIAFFDRHGTMMGNNCGIVRTISNRIVRKFKLMYSQKAFVHWYTREGMEMNEFQEAKENFHFLEMDYTVCLIKLLTTNFRKKKNFFTNYIVTFHSDKTFQR